MHIFPQFNKRKSTRTTIPEASGTYNLNLSSGGGPVQLTPKIYVVFWGWTTDPSGEQQYLTNFLSEIGGTLYYNIVAQYSSPAGFVSNPAAQLAGTWSDASAIPTSPSDTDIANEAIKAAAHFGYNADANYIIATPHGNSSAGFTNHIWCAYHASVSTSSGNLAYTNFPYQTDAGAGCGENAVNSGNGGMLDGVSIVVGHEIAETVTDPVPDTGWVDRSGTSTDGEEIGDKCAWQGLQDTQLSSGLFAIQPLWSNAQAYGYTSYGPGYSCVTTYGVNYKWTAVPGSASALAISPTGTVWSLGAASVAGGHNIYYLQGSQWIQIPGVATSLSVGPNNTPYITTPSNQIEWWNGSTWITMPGSATQVAIGSNGTLWMLGTTPITGGYPIYLWNGSSWTQETATQGGAVSLTVDQGGNGWFVGANNILFDSPSGTVSFHNYAAPPTSTNPNNVSSVGVGKAASSLFALDNYNVQGGHRLWLWTPGPPTNAYRWVQGVVATDVAVDPQGKPWIVDPSGNISYGTP